MRVPKKLTFIVALVENHCADIDASEFLHVTWASSVRAESTRPWTKSHTHWFGRGRV